MPTARDNEPPRGRDASWPHHIPWRGWLDILWRTWLQIDADRVLLVAAGATFYLLLALFPALTAFVSVYGLVADPTEIPTHVRLLEGLVPDAGLAIVRDQLELLLTGGRERSGVRFAIALLVSFWSANNGVKTLFQALTIAYNEPERRGFIRFNLWAMLFTAGAVFIGAALLIAIGLVPAALALLPIETSAGRLIRWLRWPALVLLIGAAMSTLYRFGPSRRRAKWRWILPGSALATFGWIAASALFSLYLERFADLHATYGSLGAAMGLMLWTWVSMTVLLVGAELNAEMENQTARDTTAGPERPAGRRGAVVADTLGAAYARGASAGALRSPLATPTDAAPPRHPSATASAPSRSLQ